MKFIFSKINFLSTVIFGCLLLANTVLAVSGTSGPGFLQSNVLTTMNNNVTALQDKAGYAPGMTVGDVVAAIVKAALSLLGVIFVILMVLAGYNWMTAAGDEEKITKAKDTIRAAIIGLVIVVAAYAITYFVFSVLPESSTPHGGS